MALMNPDAAGLVAGWSAAGTRGRLGMSYNLRNTGMNTR